MHTKEEVKALKLTPKREELLQDWIYKFPCSKFSKGFCLAALVTPKNVLDFIKKHMRDEWEEITTEELQADIKKKRRTK